MTTLVGSVDLEQSIRNAMSAPDPEFVKSSIRTHGSCITAEGETYGQVIFCREGFTYDVVANDFDHNVILVTDVTEESYFTDFTEAIRR